MALALAAACVMAACGSSNREPSVQEPPAVNVEVATATLTERAEQLALSQYEKGLSDVLTLLDTRQRAFDARSALISVQAQRLRNRAALHLALGGEF